MSLKLIIIFITIACGITAACFFIYKTNPPPYSPANGLPTDEPSDTAIAQKDIRQPTAAGKYYSDNKNELLKEINNYLAAAKPPSVSGTPKMIIVPHAGYEYSGSVAAYAFKNLINTPSFIKRIVLIGRSHNMQFEGVAADSNSVWNSPLGNIEVDQNFIKELKNISPVIFTDSKPHDPEHSLEVILPFITASIGSEVKIVPLLFGNEKTETTIALAEALSTLINHDTVVIISSDLSHYPSYEDANYLDNETINAILTGDANKFKQKITELAGLNRPQTATLACAEPAVAAGLKLAEKFGWEGQLLKYANSGDYSADAKNRSVGYAAIIFNDKNMQSQNNTRELNAEEQKTALQIARQTLVAAFKNENYEWDNNKLPPIFSENRGAFVTLRKNGQLRGCIGIFEPDIGLAEVIKNMALAAAFEDDRFISLQADELKDVKIEVSILSPMRRVANADEVEIGKHGVYIKKGRLNGVFLPQVATEMNWDKETFLNKLCAEKANLNRDCWRDGSTELYVFTAQIFEE